MLTILQLPVLNDNYIYLLHDPASGETAAVDPRYGQAGPGYFGAKRLAVNRHLKYPSPFRSCRRQSGAKTTYRQHGYRRPFGPA